MAEIQECYFLYAGVFEYRLVKIKTWMILFGTHLWEQLILSHISIIISPAQLSKFIVFVLQNACIMLAVFILGNLRLCFFEIALANTPKYS